MESKSVMLGERITEKHVKTFLDIMLLAMLNGEPMYGYKIIAAIHKEFGVLLSPGSLYPLLHSLEDNRLIESSFNKGKIVYHVTSRGKEKFRNTFMAYKAAMQRMSHFIKHAGGGNFALAHAENPQWRAHKSKQPFFVIFPRIETVFRLVA